MTRMWTIAAMVAAAALLCGYPAVAVDGQSGTSMGTAGRFEDAIGDAIGGAPDIVAVTVGEPDDGPLVAVSVEFASEPPLGTDMETYTDVVFVDLICDPDQTYTVGTEGDDGTDFIFGTHAITLERDAEVGGHLYVAEGNSDLYWHVVDVSVEGSTITWTVDRKLLGDPNVLAWEVLVGVEREEGATSESAEEAYDTCPDVGQPRGLYTLTKAWR